MNIRNISQLEYSHYTGNTPHNDVFLITAPGANKRIAIYSISNYSAGACTIQEGGDETDTTGDIVFKSPDGTVCNLDAPIVLKSNKGVRVDRTGMTILYTIINNSVS